MRIETGGARVEALRQFGERRRGDAVGRQQLRCGAVTVEVGKPVVFHHAEARREQRIRLRFQLRFDGVHEFFAAALGSVEFRARVLDLFETAAREPIDVLVFIAR